MAKFKVWALLSPPWLMASATSLPPLTKKTWRRPCREPDAGRASTGGPGGLRCTGWAGWRASGRCGEQLGHPPWINTCRWPMCRSGCSRHRGSLPMMTSALRCMMRGLDPARDDRDADPCAETNEAYVVERNAVKSGGVSKGMATLAPLGIQILLFP